jgi:hypothetical protein
MSIPAIPNAFGRSGILLKNEERFRTSWNDRAEIMEGKNVRGHKIHRRMTQSGVHPPCKIVIICLCDSY